MTRGAWLCWSVAAGCAAVVPVSAGVMALWISRNPVPACEASRIVCRWVIPPEEWRPGGMFYRMPEPGGLVPLAEPYLPRGWAAPGLVLTRWDSPHDKPILTVPYHPLPPHVPPPDHPVPSHVPVPVSEPGALATLAASLGLFGAVMWWRREPTTGEPQ